MSRGILQETREHNDNSPFRMTLESLSVDC